MKKPSKKTVLSALSALFIGVLGCAIWEYVISPLCTFIYVKISSLIDTFTLTFSNNTYREISKGYNDSPINDITTSMMLILLLFTCMLLAILNLYQGNKKIEDTSENSYTLNNILEIMKKKRRLNFALLILLEVLMITFMYWEGHYTFINQCKTSSLCNLEIICPYISEIEYKKLKSSFYSIQSKEDYEIFTNKLKEIDDKYSLNLK